MWYTPLVCQVYKDRPNFVFILIDDLGKEWISSYGAEEIETPNIDYLAQTGIKFNNVWSMPQCTPSRIALLTGQYPHTNGWINHYDVPRWGHGARFDPDRYPVFTRIMQEAGYRTCAAGKWQINDFRLEPEAMIHSGFDEYFMWTGGEGGNEEISNQRYWDPYIHSKTGSKTYHGKFGPDLFSDFVIQFMKENKKHPFLIYYPMVLTHSPFVATPHEPDVKTKLDKHKAMVRYTDFIVGKILAVLDELRIKNNTYLIFTTDNGTSSSIAGIRNGKYVVGGKTYLSENGVNAPFIVHHPGLIEEGRESELLVDFTDVFPTILELAQIDYKDLEDEIHGKSFASAILGKPFQRMKEWILSMGSHPALINEHGRVQSYFDFKDRVLRNHKYKVYLDTLRQIQRIFDISSDPFELNNLVHSNQDEIQNVRDAVQDQLKNMPQTDHSPSYRALDGSIWDIQPSDLNQMSQKANQRENMLGPIISRSQFQERNYGSN